MPYQIQVGSQVVEFPDSVGQDEAQRVLAEQFPATGEDIAGAMRDPAYKPSVDDYLKFEEFSKNKQTDWVNTIAQSVDAAAGMIGGAISQGAQGAAANPLNYIEGAAQGTRQLYGLVAQSQDPASPLFKFKDLVAGTGTPESRYNQFLEARDFANTTARLERGEEGLFVPPELTNPEFVQGVSMILDPTLALPGIGEVFGAGKLATRAVGKGTQLAGRAIAGAARPLERVAGAAERMTAEALGMAPEALRNTAATAGLAGALGIAPEAAAFAAIPAGIRTAREAGEALTRAGENLMTQPSRIGPLEAIGAAPGANLRQRMLGVVGQYGGDAALDASLRGLAGGIEGAAIGTGLGYLSGGQEGAAAGLGSGGVQGAAGALGGRMYQKLTGAAAKEARAGDLGRFIDAQQDPTTKALFERVRDAHGVDTASALMDVGDLVKGQFGDIDIRYLSDADFVDQYKGRARGVQVEIGDRPTIVINADILGKGKGDSPLYTLGHELFHALEKSQQLSGGATEIKNALVGRWIQEGDVIRKLADGVFNDAEIEARFNEYRDKLAAGNKQRADDLAQFDTINKKADYIASELAAEHFAALIAGQKPDAMLKGFTGLSRQLLDAALTQNASKAIANAAASIERTFGVKPTDSVLFPDLKQASPQVNAMLRDLLRARKRLDEKIMLESEQGGRVLKPEDVANPLAGRELVDMGVAEQMPDGTIRNLSTDEIRARDDKDMSSLRSIAENIPGARVVDGAFMGRFSPEQLSAIDQSQSISSRMKDKIRGVNAAMDAGNSIHVVYSAALKRAYNRITKKYSPKYDSGIRVSEREVLPYAFYLSKADNPLVKVIDITKVRNALTKELTKDGSIGGLWNNTDGFMADLAKYFTNLDQKEGARRSYEIFGDAKARFLGDFVNAQEKGGRKFVRDLRLDRIGSMSPMDFRARISEDAIQLSKQRWMPAETIGDKSVINSDEGYRIISGAKHKLYGPDGKLIGIYDTQTQAERKADATQARLQPEVRQQQYQTRDEVRQTAEAGRGDSAVGRTQGREEGRQELGAVRQAGDVGVRLSGETGELKNDMRFMPDPEQQVRSFDDLLTGNNLKVKYDTRPYKSNDMVVSTPSGDTHSRVLPSRAPMVGDTVPDSIPNHLKFKSKAELDRFIDAGISWMRQNEHKFGTSEITPWFYDKMYLAADALAGGDMNKADLYLRMFAYLSPRTAVPANYTKSYSSGIVPFLGHFPAGNRAGTFDQTRAISQIINEWKRGEHFGYRTKGVDNKVYNFYLNGAAGLVKNAISKGVDLPPGVKSHPVLSDPLTLSRLSTNDMWQMMAFSKIAEDLGVRGNVWPGMVIKGKNKGFMWSDPKQGKTVSLGSDDALEVKKILSTSGENAIKGDPGAWDWSKLTPEESSALMYDPVKQTIMVFNEGTDAGLSAKGQGALYDHVQALSGMLADKINQAGGYAGKPHLDAYNVQELLWAIIKQENPLPEMRNYESYLAPAQELFSYIDRGMEGEVPGSVVSANKSFNRWAEQLASAEIDTSASGEWKTQMEVDRQRLAQAGDTSPDVSIANEIAKRLPKWVETIANDNGWNITLDDVSVDVGAYMGDGNNVIANTAIYLRGSGADFGKLDEFMRGAGSQQGGNHIRPMRAEERLLLDRSKSGQVAKIPEELDTKLANVLTIKGAQKLSQADVVNLVSRLSELTDADGNKFLTGLSRVGDEILIHDRYYRGSWESGQFVPSRFSETSERFIDAVEKNQAAIKNVLDQFGLTGAELSNKVVTAESNPNFQYEGAQAIDRSGARSKRQKGAAEGGQVQPKAKGRGNVQPEPFYGLRGLYLDASRSAAPSQGVGFSWQYNPLQRTKSVLESKLAAKPGKMDVGDSPSRLELKLSQEDKSRISQLAVDSAVISAPDNQSMLRVTLDPGVAEDIFDSIQALVAGKEVDVTKLALRGSAEFIPTKNPVIKQAMAQAAGELTGEKAAMVEQLGRYQGLREAIKTPPKKPFAAQVEKYRETLESKEASTKKQLNSLLDRVDTMVQRGMLSQPQANKITRRTPGEPKRSATESGQQRYMPAGDMASGRSVKDHREAMDLFEKGYRLYGALYDGMEDPVRLKKATEIERFDPENLWAVPPRRVAAAIAIRNMPADMMPQPDSAMPGAYTFTGGFRAIPGKTKGSFRLYGPAGSLIGIASSLDEAQRILRRKNK
jgi:ribosomal protein S20